MLSLSSEELREAYEFVKKTYGQDVKVVANPVFQELLDSINLDAKIDETERGIEFHYEDETISFRLLDYTGEAKEDFDKLNSLADENSSAIRIWRFADAPDYLKFLSSNGGDEDWLAILPPSINDKWIPWLEQSRFGNDVETILLPGLWKVAISSHA